MESHIDPDFPKCYRALPQEVRRAALTDFRLWKREPFANSLHFKEVSRDNHVWSVRAGIGWRALGVRDENVLYWFWIGSHAEYDRLLKNLGRKNTANIQDRSIPRE